MSATKTLESVFLSDSCTLCIVLHIIIETICFVDISQIAVRKKNKQKIALMRVKKMHMLQRKKSALENRPTVCLIH